MTECNQTRGALFSRQLQPRLYLPLYIFSGEPMLWARLRPSNLDVSAGSVKQMQGIVRQIRGARRRFASPYGRTRALAARW
jgi:hypothetical protein